MLGKIKHEGESRSACESGDNDFHHLKRAIQSNRHVIATENDQRNDPNPCGDQAGECVGFEGKVGRENETHPQEIRQGEGSQQNEIVEDDGESAKLQDHEEGSMAAV